MTSLLPFIRVPDVAIAKDWYEGIGFTCVNTHEEPGCGLDWAMMRWDDAAFMLYPQRSDSVADARNCGLYFKMDSIDELKDRVKANATIIEESDETEYGAKEITFFDNNGFQVTFACEAAS